MTLVKLVSAILDLCFLWFSWSFPWYAFASKPLFWRMDRGCSCLLNTMLGWLVFCRFSQKIHAIRSRK